MAQPAVPELPAPDSAGLSYSPTLRRACILAALVVAVLPIPVATWRLLPAYQIHRLFLAFYAPVVCLLTLAYLFYVREMLARAMFKHLLDPLPDISEFYQDPAGVERRRTWLAVRNGALTVLPGILLLTSFACVMLYTSRLNQSVALASGAFVERLKWRGIAATTARSTPSDTTAAGNAWAQLDSDSLNHVMLEGAGMADIPYFVELTVLYIGSFLAPMVAFVMMGLREYAKEALGLSERHVVVGRAQVEPR